MMDINNLFCTAQNFFGNGTIVTSTDWMDCRAAMDWGSATVAPVLEVVITTAFTGGTGGSFQLCACDSAGGNISVLDTEFFVNADLTLGRIHHIRLRPRGAAIASNLTHLRVQFSNSGNNSAGAASCQLLPKPYNTDPQNAYPTGY